MARVYGTLAVTSSACRKTVARYYVKHENSCAGHYYPDGFRAFVGFRRCAGGASSRPAASSERLSPTGTSEQKFGSLSRRASRSQPGSVRSLFIEFGVVITVGSRASER